MRRRQSLLRWRTTRFKVAIMAVHGQSRQTYGPSRVQPELGAQGFPAGRDRIV